MSEVLQTAEEPQTDPLRVLIVDDHDLFRTGLRNLLEEQGVVLVGEAATGADAVKLVREHTAIGIVEAREVVDQMRAGLGLPARPAPITDNGMHPAPEPVPAGAPA